MKVKCVANRGESLPEEYLDKERNIDARTEFPLTIGKEYVVYGLICHRARIWYYVCDDYELWYPVWELAPLFTIVDTRPSQYWRIAYSFDKDGATLLLACEEWISDVTFYERLVDKESDAVRIFRRRKEDMDKEFII